MAAEEASARADRRPALSNLQWHGSKDVQVFIEGQSLLRGGVALATAVGSFRFGNDGCSWKAARVFHCASNDRCRQRGRIR